MKKFLPILILAMNYTEAAWYEGPEDGVQLRGGGGGTVHKPSDKVADHDHKIADHALRQDLYVPCCYSRGKEAGAHTCVKPSLTIVKAQDIDIGSRKGLPGVAHAKPGCFDLFIQAVSGLCGSRERRPPTPSPLMRSYSYYPGRTKNDTGFPK